MTTYSSGKSEARTIGNSRLHQKVENSHRLPFSVVSSETFWYLKRVTDTDLIESSQAYPSTSLTDRPEQTPLYLVPLCAVRFVVFERPRARCAPELNPYPLIVIGSLLFWSSAGGGKVGRHDRRYSI